MPLEADPPRRLTLAAVVAQAWLVGGGLGTAAGIALLSLSPVLGAGIGYFALFAIIAGLAVSAPVALVGGALTVAAPRWTVRWRTPVCLALPAIVAAFGAAFLLTIGHESAAAAVFPGLAVWDAGIAAFWVHRRTRALARGHDPAALAAVFR